MDAVLDVHPALAPILLAGGRDVEIENLHPNGYLVTHGQQTSNRCNASRSGFPDPGPDRSAEPEDGARARELGHAADPSPDESALRDVAGDKESPRRPAAARRTRLDGE